MALMQRAVTAAPTDIGGARNARLSSLPELITAKLARGNKMIVEHQTLRDPNDHAIDAFQRWIIIARGRSTAFRIVPFHISCVSSSMQWSLWPI